MRRWVLPSKNSVWNVLSSVKLTIVLLFTLAASSILGTFIPQQRDPDAYLDQYGQTVFRVLDFLQVFDIYHSWWFQLLLLLLVLNLIVCSLERLSGTWKIVFSSQPTLNPERFRQQKNAREFTDPRSAPALLKIYEPHLKRSFSSVRLEDRDRSRCLYAEKHRWSRLGVYVVHASVLLMLIGGLIGSLFGFDGFATIPEGESISRVRAKNSQQILELGFELSCKDFQVSFYDSGQPKEYRSDLVLLKQGKPVYEKSIRVNDPLRYQGISVYQSSYGQVPQEHGRQSAPQEIDLTIEDKGSGEVYQISTRIGQENELPAGLGILTLIDYKPNFRLRGMDLGPCLLARHLQPEQEPVHLLLPLNYPKFDTMRQGAITISITGIRGGGSPSPAEPVYYTGLQIKKDPGVWVVYSGFILMIIGCFIAFFLSHQRVCVLITPENGHSRVLISGLADKNKLGMDKLVERLSRTLSTL